MKGVDWYAGVEMRTVLVDKDGEVCLSLSHLPHRSTLSIGSHGP